MTRGAFSIVKFGTPIFLTNSTAALQTVASPLAGEMNDIQIAAAALLEEPVAPFLPAVGPPVLNVIAEVPTP